MREGGREVREVEREGGRVGGSEGGREGGEGGRQGGRGREGEETKREGKGTGWEGEREGGEGGSGGKREVREQKRWFNHTQISYVQFRCALRTYIYIYTYLQL